MHAPLSAVCRPVSVLALQTWPTYCFKLLVVTSIPSGGATLPSASCCCYFGRRPHPKRAWPACLLFIVVLYCVYRTMSSVVMDVCVYGTCVCLLQELTPHAGAQEKSAAAFTPHYPIVLIAMFFSCSSVHIRGSGSIQVHDKACAISC